MATLSDEDLLAAARRGDAAARSRLVDRHHATVRAVCASRLRSPHDVADAVQDTFERALCRLDQVADPGAVDAWLRAIAVRVCVDHVRRSSRVVCLADPVGETASIDLAPAEVVVVDETRALVLDRLRQLGERDRRALWLRDALGVPVADVASDLGLTEGSTRVLLTRARHRLRASYQGVAAWVAASWSWLRRRTGLDAVPGEVGASVLAHVALAVAVVAVGVGTVARPSEPPSPPASAPASADPARGTTDDTSAPGTSAPTAPAGMSRVASSGVPARPPAPPSGVRIGSESPAEPEALEVSTADGDGELVELLVYLGDEVGALPGVGGSDPSDDGSGDGSGDAGDEGGGDDGDRVEVFGDEGPLRR